MTKKSVMTASLNTQTESEHPKGTEVSRSGPSLSPSSSQQGWKMLDSLPVFVLALSLILEIAVEILDDLDIVDSARAQVLSLWAFFGVACSVVLLGMRTFFLKKVIIPLLTGVLLFLVHQAINLARQEPVLRESLLLGGGTFTEVLIRRVSLAGGIGLVVGGLYIALLEIRRMHLQSLSERESLLREISERIRAEEELRQYREQLEVLVGDRTAELQKEVSERAVMGDRLREAKDLLQNVIDSTPDWIFVKDLNHCFLLVNKSFATAQMLTPGDMLGRSDTEFWSKELCEGDESKDLRGFHMDDLEAFQGQLVHNDKDMATLADGSLRVFDTYKGPLVDASGRIYGVLCYSRDITEQKQAEEALRCAHDEMELRVRERTAQLIRANEDLREEIEDRRKAEGALRYSEILYQSLVENLPQFIFRKDVEGRFTFVNQRFCEQIGKPIEEILGRTDSDFFPQELADKYRRDDCRVMEEGVVLEDVEEHHAVGRETIYVQVVKVPLRNAEGRTVGVQGIFWDISERKRAEEERLQLERQVQHAQKMESLGVLAGGIAHDFNNLLMGILGNADLALGDLSPVSPVRGFLESISKAGKRAAELTRQMLAYSGRGNFLIIRINLNELVEEMMHLLKSSISKKVNIKTGFAPDLPPITADATQVRQVVMNLITNASDAIGDRSGVIMVSTGVRTCDREYLSETYLGRELPEGAYVYLEVSDDGIGMDQETLGRIFEPFFTTKFIGRGLGLAAVLGILRAHQGAISVHSQSGVGTTFRILFPKGEREAAVSTVTANSATSIWQGSGKVLVVDDEDVVRAVAESMLQRMGFEVRLASNGKEGVEVFRQSAGEFSLVLLDLTMPQMSGEEALREILATKPDARVLLCSGYTEEETYQHFAGKGVAGIIRKPYTLEILRQKIRTALEG